MIGRDFANTLFAVGVARQPWLRPYVERVASRAPVKLAHGPRRARLGAGRLDGRLGPGPFLEAGIPALFFGVEDEKQHHQPTDDYETMTHGFYVAAVETTIQMIQELDSNLDAIAAGGPPLTSLDASVDFRSCAADGGRRQARARRVRRSVGDRRQWRALNFTAAPDFRARSVSTSSFSSYSAGRGDRAQAAARTRRRPRFDLRARRVGRHAGRHRALSMGKPLRAGEPDGARPGVSRVGHCRSRAPSSRRDSSKAATSCGSTHGRSPSGAAIARTTMAFGSFARFSATAST